MIPLLNGERLLDLQSRAEARFYAACRDQLPADVLVIYSAAWLYRDGRGRISEGEADFTIVSPTLGILVVEVKGGGVTFDPVTGLWHSVDRHERANLIKDPFKQAQKERHSLADQITGHTSWRQLGRGQFPLGHAVVFPDIHDATPLLGPDRQRAFIGINADLADVPRWVARVMQFWQRPTDTALGGRGARVVEDVLCSPIDVRAVLRVAVEQAEERRIRLTAEQAKVLRTLGGRRRAVVSGGAGTGKTLLAVEKAKQLAAEGLRVLLLCYNRPLADSLTHGLRGIPLITAQSFHQLCDQRARLASATGRDVIQEARNAYPSEAEQDYFDTQLPFALALSSEVLDERFDALVIDEAQDFSEEYWFGIEMLLRDQANGHLYIFIDENQTIYPRKGTLPVVDEPYPLTSNCRNTAPIHEAGYRFYKGEAVDVPDLHGLAVTWAAADQADAQADAVCRRVRQWVAAEGLEAHDVAILVAKRPKGYCYELLQPRLDTAGVRWANETHGVAGAVLLDTFSRFKGLEAQAIVLWLGDEVIDEEAWETVYVGVTRAKSLLAVVGTARVLQVVREFVLAADQDSAR
jgi:hypothetical protein